MEQHIKYDHEGNESLVTWTKYGKIHRDDDMPAQITYYNGRVFKQEWFKDGRLHRDGYKPAVKQYIGDKKWCTIYREGNLLSEHVLHKDVPELKEPEIIERLLMPC